MKRKEDKIIELAFGELTPEDARRLEAQAIADPVAAETLQAYREMRDGLRAMADVPEHQLSNERLRDAILARGLAQKSSASAASSSRGWIWMPVAVCAIAFAAMLVRDQTRSTGPTNIVMSPSDRVAINEPTFDELIPKHRFDFSEPASEPVEKTPKAPSTLAIESRSTAAVRRSQTAREWQPTRERTKPFESHRHGTVVFHAPPAPPIDDSEPKVTSTRKSDEQPIVLIAQEKDAETGAQVATEVQSTNVLVGG